MTQRFSSLSVVTQEILTTAYYVGSPAVKKNGAFHEMSWIMWASAFLSMTEAQLAVYPAGSQVMRKGDKIQHSAHKRPWALGKCVRSFRAVRIIYISIEVIKTLATNIRPVNRSFGPRLDTSGPTD